jgi:hypothetical protein
MIVNQSNHPRLKPLGTSHFYQETASYRVEVGVGRQPGDGVGNSLKRILQIIRAQLRFFNNLSTLLSNITLLPQRNKQHPFMHL